MDVANCAPVCADDQGRKRIKLESEPKLRSPFPYDVVGRRSLTGSSGTIGHPISHPVNSQLTNVIDEALDVVFVATKGLYRQHNYLDEWSRGLEIHGRKAMRVVEETSKAAIGEAADSAIKALGEMICVVEAAKLDAYEQLKRDMINSENKLSMSIQDFRQKIASDKYIASSAIVDISDEVQECVVQAKQAWGRLYETLSWVSG